MQIDFSVLMAVYAKDDPGYLGQALESIAAGTVLPNQVVLVEDGPIGTGLKAIIEQFRQPLAITSVLLAENQGLGVALNAGLKCCSYEWVARFDADDICMPERFARQVEYIRANPGVEVFGTQVLEFENDLNDSAKPMRPLAYEHDEVIEYAKLRNPFNHMTVMFKKCCVEAAGGYQADYLYEDYCLWVRMILKGVRTANMQAALVYARTGNAMYERRGGWAYAKSEVLAQLKFLKWKFVTPLEFVRNVVVRVPVRLVPPGVRSRIYKKWLRVIVQ